MYYNKCRSFLFLLTISNSVFADIDTCNLRNKIILNEYKIFNAADIETKNYALIELADLYTKEKQYEKAKIELKLLKPVNSTFEYIQLIELCKINYLQCLYDSAELLMTKITQNFPDSIFTSNIVLLKVLMLNDKYDFKQAERAMEGYLQLKGKSLLNDTAFIAITNDSLKYKSHPIRYLNVPAGGLFNVNKNNKAWMNITLLSVTLAYTGISIYNGLYFTSLITGVRSFMRFYNGGKRAAVFYNQQNNTIKAKLKSTKLNNIYIKYF
jgi:hypothetical protein